MPPLLWQFGRCVSRRLRRSADYLRYAPDGWATQLPADAGDAATWKIFMELERAQFEIVRERIAAGHSVLVTDADERVKHITFGYVLALVAASQQRLSVLDYGGNLGEHYWLARALVPRVTLDYHCKELPAVAAIGRDVNADVTWHTDDACFDRRYDLVMLSSTIQYLPDWQTLLRRAANSSRYVFLADVPTVRSTASFVAVQRIRGITQLHAQLNHAEIRHVANGLGLGLVREFPMGAHPTIESAPEQPTCVGWLFEHRSFDAR